MKRLIRSCAGALACGAALLSGCALPVYKPAPGAPVAKVQWMGFGVPRVCQDGKAYQVWTQESGGNQTFEVATGSRISVGAWMYFDHGNVNYSCQPALSFVPLAGQSYLANAGVRTSNGCFFEVVRADAGKVTGVALDDSVGAPLCRP